MECPMFKFKLPSDTMTARRVAVALRRGALTRVVIDTTPRSDPQNAYPRAVLFAGECEGKRWTLSSVEDFISYDDAAPPTMRRLFARIARGATGDGCECAKLLGWYRRRWGLRTERKNSDRVVEVSRSA